MRKKLHADASQYLVSPISLLQIFPSNLQDRDVDLYELISKECMEIFGYVELVFDVVSDSDLYDMNSYSDGVDGEIQRNYNYPKPEFFTLLIGLYGLRMQLYSEFSVLYDFVPSFIVTRPCPSLTTKEK